MAGKKQKTAITVVITILLIVTSVFVVNFFSGKVFKNTQKTLEQMTVEERAEKAGYKIAYNGDSSDKTGRAILADGVRNKISLADSFGWKNVYYPEIKKEERAYFTGLFKGITTLDKSKDLYLTLEAPDESTDLKNYEFNSKNAIVTTIRVLAGDPEFSSISADLNTEGKGNTLLAVENLDVGKKTGGKEIEGIVDFEKISKPNLEKLFKKGDVITVYLLKYPESLTFKNRTIVIYDKNHIPLASIVSIRRFGGMEQIYKEVNLP